MGLASSAGISKRSTPSRRGFGGNEIKLNATAVVSPSPLGRKSSRKEEEQRRQTELEILQALKHRQNVEQKLALVEKQIFDLEKHYHKEFSSQVGNGVVGYSFNFLGRKASDELQDGEAAGKAHEGSKKDQVRSPTPTTTDTAAEAAQLALAAVSSLYFSKSSATSPVHMTYTTTEQEGAAK